ncbi:MAG: type IV secretion system protein, partial [bacterium]
MPTPGYDPIGTVQQAITSLLSTQEPQFIAIGNRLFLSFATILLVWHGIRLMLAWRESGEHMFSFAKLLLIISFGYAMIAYYESPIPGIGSSFSNLITDQAVYLARIISGQSVQNAQQTLNTLWNSLEQPDAWSIIANLLYWTMLIVIAVAQFALMFVISFSMIASAVCGLVGPIFVPFFIVPKLDFLFWSWLKAFLQYSFMPVVALAFLMIFERFIFQFLTTIPPGITEDLYMIYG